MTNRSFLRLSFIYIFSSSSVLASVITFTDQSQWLAALSGQNIQTENFEGPVSLFAAQSSNVISGHLSIYLSGGIGDPGPTGLTGRGYLQGEVDGNGSDLLSLDFNVANLSGFALIGLQNDSLSSPLNLALDEIAMSANDEVWILSELIELDVSSIPFLGFMSDSPINEFSMFHASLVSNVTRNSEEFYLDGLMLASMDGIAVPEPASYVLLLVGLLMMSLNKLRNGFPTGRAHRNWLSLLPRRLYNC